MIRDSTFLNSTRQVLYYSLNLFALISIILLFHPYGLISKGSINFITHFMIFLLIIYLFIKILQNIKILTNPVFIFDVTFITLGLVISNTERVFQFYLLGRQSFYLIQRLSEDSHQRKLHERLIDNPAVVMLLSFMLTIFIGTLLLMLPTATVSSEETSFIGALFTSTSATCVTGLIVYDTGTHFTFFGQIIILFLIQIGGLGIMTISSAFAIMLGQKMGLKSENLIQNVVGESNKLDMVNLVKNILIITFIFEVLGALLLYFTFSTGMYQPLRAVYHSVFHSVSAFCNAGFSLFQNSFMDFRYNMNINFVITTLIIFGGIGFPVMSDIQKTMQKRFKLSRLSLHSKIVLTSTIILIILGVIGFYISEYNSEMKGFNISERLISSYFQSVTTRTAGFNTIDNSNLSMGSVLLSIILMFIGASPGSTGGGIKTTALVIVIVSVLSIFRGNREANIYRRKVSNEIVLRVMALIALSIVFISLMLFLLFLFEPLPFEKILFEVFSAFGTVGLSMGITAELSQFGKLIIILLMYMGRVGPLTLIYALSEKKVTSNFRYVEEKISIG